MKRIATVVALALAVSIVPAAAPAHHELPVNLEGRASGALPDAGPDVHSKNMKIVGNFDNGGEFRQGSDLAFWKNLAVVGNYDNPGGFYLLNIRRPRSPQLVGQFECRGSQADVSIFRNLVLVSVDATLAGPECGASNASTGQVLAGDHWEGLRIVSIKNRGNPKQIATVDTDCGSHTHTIIPDLGNKTKKGGRAPRLLVYVLSYPIGGQGSECNVATHRKISVVSIPLRSPRKARVIGTADVSPAIGCHDVTVFPKRNLAAAACISESQIWNVRNPANPRVIGRIRNPAINIHHSSTFTWDGDTLVLGDELGGAAFTPGCVTAGNAPLAALWFYDVSKPRSPQQLGWYQIPQQEADTIICGAHNFNMVPLKGKRDILVSGWYNGGTTVVDITNPASPRQIGHYIAKEGTRTNSWSSYWYNGFIYANNFDEDVWGLAARKSRGVDVMKIRHRALKPSKQRKLSSLNPQYQVMR